MRFFGSCHELLFYIIPYPMYIELENVLFDLILLQINNLKFSSKIHSIFLSLSLFIGLSN